MLGSSSVGFGHTCIFTTLYTCYLAIYIPHLSIYLLHRVKPPKYTAWCLACRTPVRNNSACAIGLWAAASLIGGMIASGGPVALVADWFKAVFGI
jgi:hypothetical protein